MIFRNVKTALFVSLIAAMVLPFSMMDYTEAQTSNDRAKLVKHKNALVAQLKTTDNEKERAEIQVVIDRIDLVLALLQVKEDLRRSAIGGESADEQTRSLLNQISTTYDESEAQTLKATSSSSNVTRAGTANFQTSTQTKFNCDTISTQTGYNWGTVRGVDLVESYLVARQGYPSSIAVMENNYCTVKNFDNGYVKFRDILDGVMCTAPLTHANDVERGFCYQFGTGTPILITSYAWYDGWVPFNITEGWDFIWVP